MTYRDHSNFRKAMAVVAVLLAVVVSPSALRAVDAAPINSIPIKAYAFRMNTEGLILDANGVPVASANVSVYLKDLNIPNITVVCLWIDGPDSIKHMVPTVQAFGGSFTKIIVKQWETGDKAGLIDLPAPSKEANQAAISAAYPGRAYPKSIAGGPVAQRPAGLRPGVIPAKVRYQFADNTVVEEAAGKLMRHFLNAEEAANPIWAANVIVQSGAWSLFSGDSQLGKNDALRYTARIPTLSRALDLPQILLRNSADIGELDSSLRKIVAAEGGARVRALKSDELRTWWQYIPYDITEPVFVLETRNGGHRFVIGLNLDGIAMVDELTGLPSLTQSPGGVRLD